MKLMLRAAATALMTAALLHCGTVRAEFGPVVSNPLVELTYSFSEIVAADPMNNMLATYRYDFTLSLRPGAWAPGQAFNGIVFAEACTPTNPSVCPLGVPTGAPFGHTANGTDIQPRLVATYNEAGTRTVLPLNTQGAEIDFGSQPSDAHGGAMLLWGKNNTVDGWKPDGANALLTWQFDIQASAGLTSVYFSDLYGNTTQHAYFEGAHYSDQFANDGHVLSYQAGMVPEPSTYAMLTVGLLCIGAMRQRRRARAACI